MDAIVEEDEDCEVASKNNTTFPKTRYTSTTKKESSLRKIIPTVQTTPPQTVTTTQTSHSAFSNMLQDGRLKKEPLDNERRLEEEPPVGYTAYYLNQHGSSYQPTAMSNVSYVTPSAGYQSQVSAHTSKPLSYQSLPWIPKSLHQTSTCMMKGYPSSSVVQRSWSPPTHMTYSRNVSTPSNTQVHWAYTQPTNSQYQTFTVGPDVQSSTSAETPPPQIQRPPMVSYDAHRHREQQSILGNEYIHGRLDGQLNARYMAMFQAGRHETDRKFTGNLDDYPMFRQELQHHYELLYHSEPRTLLKKIANSISDDVWYYIKSAWINRDPWEALNAIWQILEDQYGEPRKLLNHSVKQVLNQNGIMLTTSSLTSCRAKLRNLKALAQSIDCEKEIEKPKLLIKIVDTFQLALKTKFETDNPNPQRWSFSVILDFIDRQVETLRYRERHLMDISSVIEAEKPKTSDKKPRTVKTYGVQEKVDTTVSEEAGSTAPPATKEKPRCELHPSSDTHDMADCRIFKAKTDKERRTMAKEKGRCFSCIGPHWRRYCTAETSAPCEKCGSKLHHTLLHVDSDGKRDKSKTAKVRKGTSSNQSKDAVKLGIVGNKPGEPEEGATVPIMALQAVTYSSDGKFSKCVPFYALLDTGAETTLCSRKLAEKLFGWRPEDSINLQFLDGKPKKFQCMTKHLYLKAISSQRIVTMQDTVFLDSQLPCGQSIPSRDTLKQYPQVQGKFPIIAGSRKIDMILGAPHIHQFGLFFETTWVKTEPGEPKVGCHELGEIWWGLKKDESTTPYIRLIRCMPISYPSTLDDHSKEQLKEVISETHGITEEECADYMPGILDEIIRYTKDQMSRTSRKNVLVKKINVCMNFIVRTLKKLLIKMGKNDFNFHYLGKGLPFLCLKVLIRLNIV